MFVPFEDRKVDNPTIASVSINFVEPYKANLPRFYEGNETVMLQGQIFIMSFYLPMLACDFLADKDAYMKAVADSCLVPPSHVTLKAPTTFPTLSNSAEPDENRQIVMWVVVHDVEIASNNLKLDRSSAWKKDPLNVNPPDQVQRMASDGRSDGPTAERVNFHMLANRVLQVENVRVLILMDVLNGRPNNTYLNEVPGAPVSFVRQLMSGNSSKLVRCAWTPLNSAWQDADCKYFDTGMFMVLWGIFIMPPAILVATILFLIGRHIREVSCSPYDRSIPLDPKLRLYSCY